MVWRSIHRCLKVLEFLKVWVPLGCGCIRGVVVNRFGESPEVHSKLRGFLELLSKKSKSISEGETPVSPHEP